MKHIGAPLPCFLPMKKLRSEKITDLPGLTCLKTGPSHPRASLTGRGFLTDLGIRKVILTVLGKMDSGRMGAGGPEAGS